MAGPVWIQHSHHPSLAKAFLGRAKSDPSNHARAGGAGGMHEDRKRGDGTDALAGPGDHGAYPSLTCNAELLPVEVI